MALILVGIALPGNQKGGADDYSRTVEHPSILAGSLVDGGVSAVSTSGLVVGESAPAPVATPTANDTAALNVALEDDVLGVFDEEPPGGQVEIDGIPAIICSYWPEDCAKAIRVFQCESGPDLEDGNPYDGYVGVAQIDSNLHAARFHGDPTSPNENLRVAREIYDERGWSAWPVCGYR